MLFSIRRKQSLDKITYAVSLVYIVLALFVQQNLYDGVISSPIILYVVGLLIVFLNIAGVNWTHPISKNKNIVFLALVLFLFIVLNSIFVRKEILAGAIFSLVVSVLIGAVFNRISKGNYTTLIPFWFLVFYIFTRLLDDPQPNNVFINSKNYISFYLIFTVLPYYYVRLSKKMKASIVPALIVFGFSVYSYGRGGILASLVLFVGVIWDLIPKNKVTKWITISGVIISLAFGVSYYINNSLKNDERELVRFESLGKFFEEGGRAKIVNSYFNNMDLKSFLLGIKPETVLESSEYNKTRHMHSSFLLLHSVTGIAGLVFFLFVFYKLYRNYKENLPLFFVFCSLLLRITTETGALFAYFDYAIWMFLFNKDKTTIE